MLCNSTNLGLTFKSPNALRTDVMRFLSSGKLSVIAIPKNFSPCRKKCSYDRTSYQNEEEREVRTPRSQFCNGGFLPQNC